MVQIDDSRDSVLVVRFAGVISDDELEQYLSRYEAWAEERTRFGVVIAAEEGTRLTTAQRVRQVEWIEANEALLSERSVGTAFVLPAPSTRFLLSTILMLTRLPNPYQVFRTEGDGLDWIASRLSDGPAGVTADRA